MSDPKHKAEKMPRVGLRPFAEVLVDLAGGEFEKNLTKELGELVRAVEETKAKGTLSIKIEVERDVKTLRVKASSEVKLPKVGVEATSFFTDDKGGLHRENPRQTNMFDGPRSTTEPSNDPDN